MLKTFSTLEKGDIIYKVHFDIDRGQYKTDSIEPRIVTSIDITRNVLFNNQVGKYFRISFEEHPHVYINSCYLKNDVSMSYTIYPDAEHFEKMRLGTLTYCIGLKNREFRKRIRS